MVRRFSVQLGTQVESGGSPLPDVEGGCQVLPLSPDLPHVSEINSTPRARVPATPLFDQLYDTARELGTCEVVLEHIPYQRRRPGLAVVLRRTDNGITVHRAVVRSTVEEAATRIREKLESEAPQKEEQS